MSNMNIVEENKVAQENKKPHFMQRLASGLVDLCLIFLSYWGLYSLFINSPLADGFNYYHYQIIETQDAYKLETGFGEKVLITEENKDEYQSYYKHYDEDENEYVVVNIENVDSTISSNYSSKLLNDNVYQSNVFNRKLILYGINVLAGFIATSVFLLAIPSLNKRRASIGQLAGEISMFSKRFETHARWYHILIRYLFIFILECALPFLFLELFTFILIPTLFLIVGSISKSGRTLHDLVSGVRPIDKRTYSPLIPEKDEIENEDAE